MDEKTTKHMIHKKIITLIAVIAIIIGAGISGYPYIAESYFNYRQQDLIYSWTLKNHGIGFQNVPQETESREMIPNTENTALSQAENIPQTEEEYATLENEIFEEDVNAFFDFNYALQNMNGTIKIPDLDLVSPILIGDTKQNLNIGICEAPDSCKLGEVGNYILAGHYSKIRGRHFNRLPEIQIGASVFISSADRLCEYEVYEVMQVKAEDTWAVQINVQERTATLITCDYSVSEPYGRIVVKCKLKQ
jgi:sortase A